MRQILRQPRVGQHLRELREHAGLSRAELSAATGVNASAIARLENGDDVRLSTYFPVIDHFLGLSPETWTAAERFIALPAELRGQVTDLIRWFGRPEPAGGEDD